MSGAGFESPTDPLGDEGAHWHSGTWAQRAAALRAFTGAAIVFAHMRRRSYNWSGGGHLMQETRETLSELKQRIEHVLRRL